MWKPLQRIHFALVALVALAIMLPLGAQHLAQRLILKDGSYQPTTKWEIKGDRVRFYSAERYQWEEIPVALIDWEATESYNRDREQRRRRSQQLPLSPEEEEEIREEEERSPTIAPGVRLPEGRGVYLLDIYRDQPQLIELVQDGGKTHIDRKGNILRAAINPFAKSRGTIELKGRKARIQSHVPRPSIFINIDPEEDQGEKPAAAAAPAGKKEQAETRPEPDVRQRYRLVRLNLNKKKDGRVVGNLRIAFTGRVSEQQTFVESVTEPVTGRWVKVTPLEDLAIGEYALVEMLTARQINLFVWDFGVNPRAPENPAVWTPPAPVSNKAGAYESPVLINKPRAPQ